MACKCSANREIAVCRDENTIDIGQSRRRIYMVPQQVRYNKDLDYSPAVVPLGPYHHGRVAEFDVAEPLKNDLRDILCPDKAVFLSTILGRIGQVRHFYRGQHYYKDDELAEMMLRDTCFLLSYMKGDEHYELICRRLGKSGALSLAGDVRMLENQIPLWLINWLVPLVYPGQRSRPFMLKFLNSTVNEKESMKQLPWGNGEEEPLHLLEAMHRTIFRTVKKASSTISSEPTERSITIRPKMESRPSRSATDLKAKGIHFRPSSTSLTDITFSSFAFNGRFHLPILYVTTNTVILYSNLIAFEMSPETETNFGITSYFNFMKTLIESAKDVQLLRESGILYSMLASDEEVVRVFKSMNTCGFCTDDLASVKMRIDEHCKSKAKTWMAELINTKFQSPWKAIGLFAAVILLFLTVVQTYYTVYPQAQEQSYMRTRVD